MQVHERQRAIKIEDLWGCLQLIAMRSIKLKRGKGIKEVPQLKYLFLEKSVHKK